MFTPEYFIDSFQNGKKQFINTFVTHTGIKNALVEFVDKQTEYTKSAVKAGTDVANKLSQESTRAFFEISKIDASKLFKTSK